MGRYADWLLVELERLSEGKLPDSQRNELLREVEAHLDAAIHARLELGVAPTEAEREAVAAFGSPEEVIRPLAIQVERPSPGFDWPIFVALLIIQGLLGAFLTLHGFQIMPENSVIDTYLFLTTVVMATCWIAYRSLRLARFQILPLLSVTFLSGLLQAGLMTTYSTDPRALDRQQALRIGRLTQTSKPQSADTSKR